MTKQTKKTHVRSKKGSAPRGSNRGHKSRPSGKAARSPGSAPDTKAVSRSIARASHVTSTQRHQELGSSALDASITNRGENHEDIGVVINPLMVAQYIGGVVFSLAGSTDRPTDLYEMNRMFQYYFANLNNLDNLGVNTWPEAILELGYSLRPRTIGKFHYVPLWDVYEAVAVAVNTNSDNSLNLTGFSVPYANNGTTVNTNGFLTALTNFPGQPNDYEVAAWQAAHADQLKLTPIVEGSKLDTGCASAFAWDVGGVNPMTAVNAGDPVIGAIAGYNTGTGAFYYVRADSSVGLETPIKRPHLAKIRVGTVSGSYAGYVGSPSVFSTRSPQYCVPVKSTPGTLGFRSVMKGMGKDPQLKQIPSLGIFQEVVARLEQAYGPTTSIAGSSITWYNGLAKTDIAMMAYALVKRSLRKYAGCEIGARVINPQTGLSSAAEPYTNHMDDTLIEMVRVPEAVSRVLGSFAAYFDDQGSLLPLMVATNLSNTGLINSPILTGTYTGTPTYAAIDPSLNTQRFPANTSALIVKFKQFEKSAAGFSNLRLYSQMSPTLLDVSVLYGPGGDTLMGFCARRPLSGGLFSRALLSFAYLSYSSSPVGDKTALLTNPTQTTNYLFNWESVYSHSFRQTYRRDLSGYGSFTTLRQAAWYDGYVPLGALTSNVSGNDGPDTGPSALDPSSAETKKVNGIDYPNGPVPWPHPRTESVINATDDRSAALKLRDFLVPTHGKYCGPGYSAGKRGGGQPMKDGKFLVEPEDPLDEACKRHDEGYHAASGDPAKLAHADKLFIKEIMRLRPDQAGFYGRRAAELFYILNAIGGTL